MEDYLFREYGSITHYYFMEEEGEWYVKHSIILRRKKTLEEEWEERTLSSFDIDKDLDVAMLHATLTTTTLLEEKGMDELLDEEHEKRIGDLQDR